MNEKKLVTLSQPEELVAATQGAEVQGCRQDEQRYRHIEATLKRFGYGRQSTAGISSSLLSSQDLAYMKPSIFNGFNGISVVLIPDC